MRSAIDVRTTRRVVGALLVALLAAGPLGCASTTGLTPVASPMPSARASLQPEYRMFYDALADYGDWKLIEPFGYVFRPRVSFESWQPYNDGFWAPTDVFGWVWVSAEPFGWATYHYGRWLYDDYQGWVWVPGLDWAPAWVAWQGTNDLVGWAPLSPHGASNDRAPGGGYLYVSPADLSATDLRTEAIPGAKLGTETDAARAIVNLGHADGVEFNRGPRFDAIERVAGPLRLARVEDIVPSQVVSATRRSNDPPKAPEMPGLVKRAAEKAASEARATRDAKDAPTPTSVPMLRPLNVKEWMQAAAAKKAAAKSAPRDTIKH